jgi:hypothetical protein
MGWGVGVPIDALYVLEKEFLKFWENWKIQEAML